MGRRRCDTSKISPKPWVFVYVPLVDTEAPSYYVILQSELHEILAPIDAEYNRRFEAKHGVEYGDRPGVVTFTRAQAEPFRNAWDKIIRQLLIQ